MLGRGQPQGSLLGALLNRQLLGGPVHRLPFVAEFSVEGECCGTVVNNPGLTGTPAFAAQFSKVYNHSKLLAVADEEGYVSVVDTAAPLPTEMADDWGPNKPRAQWLAHRNAVFDVAWCNDDANMLTASGDQTVALWDTGHADQLASFRGHSGSVKAVCPLPAAPAIFASGARDGALMVWDARVAARADPTTGEAFHSPVITVQDAHAFSDRQKRRRTPLQGRTRPSVTSLTFMDGHPGSLLATGGVDGIVKFWDLRQSGAPAAAAAPALDLARLCDASLPPISQKQHGITSLALHPQGSQLLVSLTGGHHFIYDPLRPDIGPTRWFGGHTVASFYVKAAWSPDGTHIISGSTDRSVYIWQVDAPDGASPHVLAGHQGEVTAVAWCPTDFHQIATTADDATLKIWRIQRQQPEEAADAAGPRQPWVYPWQQAQQVQAAAAAAAAYCAVGVPPGAATPGAALGSVATAAASAGGATPWSTAAAAGLGSAAPPGLSGSSSARMLAALRGAAGPAGSLAGATPAPPSLAAEQQQQQQQQSTEAASAAAAAPAVDENMHANVRRQQQLEPPLSVQQQQQQTGGPSARGASFMTPFMQGSPAAAGAGRSAATAGTSGRPPVRRIGDLLSNPAPSTRRTKQQKSIASFLRSPAAAAGGGSASGAAAAGARCGARDLAAGAAPGSASGAKRGSPLPAGLGGSSLPSPRSAKRLRTTFEAAGPSQPGSARKAGPAARLASAAAALEPSPDLGGGKAGSSSGAGASGGPALQLQRQGSSRENLPAGNL